MGRVREITVRFTKPVLPGAGLRMEIWRSDGEAVFRVLDEEGNAVLDRGALTFEKV